MKSRLVALTVLLVGVALARAAPQNVAVVAVALPLLGVVTGPRFRLDRVGQAALSVGARLVGVLIPRVLVGPELFARDDPAVLGERALLLAVPMLVIAAARTLVDSPLFGARLPLAAALLALAAAGRTQSGPVYPALAALALAAGFSALHANEKFSPGAQLSEARWLDLR